MERKRKPAFVLGLAVLLVLGMQAAPHLAVAAEQQEQQQDQAQAPEEQQDQRQARAPE
jgi:hypothetical protein